MHDLRYAVRSLQRSPLFAAMAVLTLAIGIGATTAIFSTVNATLLRPLPYPRPGDLVDVHTRYLDARVTTGFLSAVEIDALNRTSALVERAAGVSGQPFDATLLRDRSAPITLTLNGVTEGFFETMGLPMAAGRAFTHQEHIPAGRDAPLAVVISHRAWTTIFDSDPAIVGRTIRIAEAPVANTVVGVASPQLDFPRGTDVWYTVRPGPQETSHNYLTVARLRPGVTIERLRAAATVAMAALARAYPSDVNREFVLRPLTSALVGDLGPQLLIVLGATVLLLLLACVNVTNLLLARGMARTREVAVRTALGASRGRVLRQLMTESMVLAAAGALAALLLAFAAVRLMLVLGASSLPRLDTVPFDLRVLLFAFAALLVSGLTMGIAPAWRLAGTDIRTLLNDSGRSATSGRATSRVMSGLIVAEISLAIALVAGAGWLVQSFARLRATPPGFVAAGRLLVDVRPSRRFATPTEAHTWSAELITRLRAATGGAEVGSTSTFPLRTDRDATLNIELDSEAPNPDRVSGGHVRMVTRGFFEAMGTRLLAGRMFTDDDRAETQRVAIVNRAFVRRFLPTTDPLASSFAYGYPTVDRKTMTRIVGVVEDMRYKSLAEEAEPTYYLPQAQGLFPIVRHAAVVAMGRRNPETMIADIRAALTAFDPQLVLTFTPVPEIVAQTLSRQQLGMTLMLIFGCTALGLAAVGIYGVIAYAAAQRSGEIATRIALGASSRGVFWLMMRAGLRLAVAGVIVGLAGAYAAGRIVASNVFEMRAADPTVLIAAAAIVAAVTGVATMIPAIRASRLDPVRALRSG